MGLSNYLANSRISQAGVVPNEASRPVSPYEGQVIYQTDTDRTLVWNGTAWVDPSTGKTEPSGFVRITTCTASFTGGTAGSVSKGVVTIGTNNTAITVSNAFSADYDAYKIIISGGVASTANTLLLNLDGSTASYYSSLMYHPYSTATGNVQGVGSSNIGYWNYAGGGSTAALHMDVTVNNPFLAKPTTFISSYAAMATDGSAALSNGYHNVSTSYTGFRITLSTGNITGGTVRVYGYNQ